MLFNQKPFSNYQLASITMQASAARYYFPDLPQLRNVLTTNLVFYGPQTSANDNNGFAATFAFQNAYVTFNVNGEEVIRQMDLQRLQTISVYGAFYPQGLTSFANLQIDYAKSYVELAPGATPPTFPSCFQFGVYYTRKNYKVQPPKKF